MTDLFGTSGRHMLAALIAGERDANTLAALALGRLRRKLPQQARARRPVYGPSCPPHPGGLVFHRSARPTNRRLAQQIGVLVAPLQTQIAQLDSIPGVDLTAARDILAETGTDMSRLAPRRAWRRGPVCLLGTTKVPANGGMGEHAQAIVTCDALVQCAWAARNADISGAHVPAPGSASWGKAAVAERVQDLGAGVSSARRGDHV